MEERLQETLDALERGENPPCPFCGATYSHCYQDDDEDQKFFEHEYEWECGSLFFTPEGTGIVRASQCYENQIKILQQENERVEEELAILAKHMLCIYSECRQYMNKTKEIQDTEFDIETSDSDTTEESDIIEEVEKKKEDHWRVRGSQEDITITLPEEVSARGCLEHMKILYPSEGWYLETLIDDEWKVIEDGKP